MNPILRITTLILMLALAAHAAPNTTTIADVVYRANGTPAAGTLLISWPAFTTADNHAIAAGSLSLAIGPAGVVQLSLAPNEGATPAGTSYVVVFKLDDGSTSTEHWVVPLVSPTTISAIRSEVMPASQAVQVASRQYVDTALATKANDAAVVHNTGDENIAGAKQFAVAPTVPDPTLPAQAVNRAYVDQAVTGDISAASLWAPVQSQNKFVLRSTLTRIARMHTAAPAQLHVANFGDSVAGAHWSGANASDTYGIGPRLRQMLGDAGYGLAPHYVLAGGAVLHDGSGPGHELDYSNWITGVYFEVPVGGSVQFDVGGGYQLASKLLVFFISEPGTASFNIQSKRDTDPDWVNEAVGVSTEWPSKRGSVWSTTKAAAAPYMLKVTGVSGTVKIISAGLINTLANGYVASNLALGGLLLSDAMSCPAAVRDPILTALAPDLVTYEMKEEPYGLGNYPDGRTFAQELAAFREMMAAANPLMDFIWFGSPPVGDGHDDADQVAQNHALRALAVANNDFYWDAYYPSLDYATEVALGWITPPDGVHPTATGMLALQNLLWRDLGFGALFSAASPRDVATDRVTANRAFFCKAPGATCSGPTVETDLTFGLDLYLRPLANRAILGKDLAGNDTFLLASTMSSYGQANNWLPPFRLTGNVPASWKGPLLRSADANTAEIYDGGLKLTSINVARPFMLAAMNGSTATHSFTGPELITLNTGGTTTDSSANLLPAGAIIESVTCRVTTTISTATDWAVGDAIGPGRFCTADSNLAAGTTAVCLNHWTVGRPEQTTAAKLRITTTGIPAAGAVRCVVYYSQFTAPTS